MVDKQATVIRAMFNSIAWRYDFANHLLSLGVDRLWRKRLVRRLSRHFSGDIPQILDVCCGTGDLALELSALGPVFGADFAHFMLLRALQKGRSRSSPSYPLHWVETDALALPFAAGRFDLVSAAFGIRNFASLEEGIRELARVLRPGGVLAVLEFSMPRGILFPALYRFYFRNILPRIGGLVTGNEAAYRYLPASVHLFSSPAEIRALLQRFGLTPLSVESWTGGIAACYLAQKDSPPAKPA